MNLKKPNKSTEKEFREMLRMRRKDNIEKTIKTLALMRKLLKKRMLLKKMKPRQKLYAVAFTLEKEMSL